jgi:hypothetical protein
MWKLDPLSRSLQVDAEMILQAIETMRRYQLSIRMSSTRARQANLTTLDAARENR